MSNRLTFSLASLVFLIVLGLVFVPTAVMAHNYPAGGAGENAYEASSHPLTTDLADDPTTPDADDTITAHHSHPTVESIMLKADKDSVRKKEAKIAAADDTFTLVIKFSEAVGVAADASISAFDTTDTAEDGDFPIDGVTITMVDTKGNIIANGFDDLAAADIERSGDDNDTFEVTVTVDTPVIPTAKEDDALEMVEVRVSVPEDQVYSLAMLPSDGHALRNGAGNLESMIEKFMLVKEFTDASAPPDPTKVMFAVSGTPSVTDRFTVTFTSTTEDDDGDLMGTMLMVDDIAVTDGYVVGGSLDADPDADPANTVWYADVQPRANAEMVSVTIKASSKTAEPDADDGVLSTSAPEATLSSITAADGADDTEPFLVTLTFAEALPDDVSVMATDLMVTNGTAGRPYSPAGDEVWRVLITPTDGMDTMIGLSKAGMDRFAYSGKAITVTKGIGTGSSDVTAAYAKGIGPTTGTTTISEGVIGANDFVVIGHDDLPDLDLFFDIGGTIGLDDGDATDDKNLRNVVISEILWGLDLGEEVLANQTKHQFIELYNTTAAHINLKDWKLVFTRGNVVPPSDIDQVSNRGVSGWEVDTGDTGKSGRVAETFADNPQSTITPVNIVSMYRKINYTKVEKMKDGKADPSREEQLKGIPGGNVIGSWANSQIRGGDSRWIYETPGAKHHTREVILTASSVAGTPFRINEIGNDSNGDNDWVELHNVSDADASLKNYQLTVVTDNATDTELFDFTGDVWDNRKIPAGGFVVISTRHPRDTDLATGRDISVPDDEELKKGLIHLYVVKSGWNLPDHGKFALILRGGHGDAHKSEKTANHLIDVVATRQGAFSATNTRLWPLKVGGHPHDNVIDGGDENFAAGKVYQRNSGNGRGEKQFAVAGYTGIGYDVKASKISANHGTPGYDNGAAKVDIAGIGDGTVTISEIMVDVGDSPRRTLPQWIELHNASDTMGVNLEGWKLHIENAAQENNELETNTFSATITLGKKFILPNQTLLIASRSGDVRDPNHFPPTRVVDLWTTKAHRDALEMTRATDPVLSTRGFHIQLVDKDGKAIIDEVGNLDGNRRTRDNPAWALPMSDDPNSRSSLIRVYDSKIALNGTAETSWILASDTILAFERTQAYFGDADDVGTPGYRTGGPLPVSMSKFRPERLDDGSIVVRWITESELNNAGFNILRSDTRNGQFTQINTSLIKGQGTTSERTTYAFPDTSAKPNVVYYYQIQDVSLDGNVTTLRQSRLKGDISAAGKLTTTWGELKALQ